MQLQRAMAAEAEAAREARAKVIAAEGEQKASRALREAAETIADSHSALQVSSKSNVIFPMRWTSDLAQGHVVHSAVVSITVVWVMTSRISPCMHDFKEVMT